MHEVWMSESRIPSTCQSTTQIAVNHIDTSQLAKFSKAMQYLSLSQKIAIIAEARPLHDELSQKQLDVLDRELKNTSLIDSELLTKVATAYDYSVTRNLDGVYLLSKRYTDPEDLPYVTDGEAIADYQSILTRIKDFTTADFGPSSSPSQANIQQQLGASFTLEQRAKLTTGLPADQLTTEQSGLLWEAAYTHYVYSTAKGAETLVHYLKTLRNPAAKFKNIYCPPLGVTIFCMVGPFTVNGTAEYGFSYGAVGTPGASGKMVAPDGTGIGLGLFSRTVTDEGSVALIRSKLGAYLTTDPNAPTEGDRAVVAYNMSSPPDTISLGEFVRTLKQTPPPSGAITATYEVTPELAIKPVSPFGVKSLSSIQRLRAVAELYGLRLIQPKRNEWRLTTPTASPMKSVADLPACLIHLFPLPWQHACQTSFAAEFVREQEAELAREQKMAPAQRPKKPMPVDPNIARFRGRLNYYPTVARRVRAIVEPQLEANANGKIVSECHPEVLRLMTLLTMSGFVVDMASVPAPPYLVDFSKAVITGSVNDRGEIQVLSISGGTGQHPVILFSQQSRRVMPVPVGVK